MDKGSGVVLTEGGFGMLRMLIVIHKAAIKTIK